MSPALGDRYTYALNLLLTLDSRPIAARCHVLTWIEHNDVQRETGEPILVLFNAVASDNHVVDRHVETSFGIRTREQAGVAGQEVQLTRVLFHWLIARPHAT